MIPPPLCIDYTQYGPCRISLSENHSTERVPTRVVVSDGKLISAIYEPIYSHVGNVFLHRQFPYPSLFSMCLHGPLGMTRRASGVSAGYRRSYSDRQTPHLSRLQLTQSIITIENTKRQHDPKPVTTYPKHDPEPVPAYHQVSPVTVEDSGHHLVPWLMWIEG